MLFTRREAFKQATILAGLVSVSLAACGVQEAPTESSASQAEASPSMSETDGQSSGQTNGSSSVKLRERIAAMSLEHKVAQLFMVTPEQLTGVGQVVAAGESTRVALSSMPVGGLLYNTPNLIESEQLTTMLANTREYSLHAGDKIGVFLAIDEEGGQVSRLANAEGFDLPHFDDVAQLGSDAHAAAELGRTIASYLTDFGFNLDFAPVADVLTNPNNSVIGTRAFSGDPQQVADCVVAQIKAMDELGCLSCVKHFPGHGDTAEDSHLGMAISNKTIEELESCEYVPFKAAIDAGVRCVMIGHISLPQIVGDELPASLSSQIITNELREKLGFDGLVISDSFQMEAITSYYSAAEAAVAFISAGGDIVLAPADLEAAYQAVLTSAREGRISLDRIDESVQRILAVKERMGLLPE